MTFCQYTNYWVSWFEINKTVDGECNNSLYFIFLYLVKNLIKTQTLFTVVY